ncbi:hypothetical protein SLA2020_001560 [Shorea laevis]
MLRCVTALLGRSVLVGRSRSFSIDLSAAQTTDPSFVEAWRKVVPTAELPKTPLAFMQPRLATPSSILTKLTVNFVLPYAYELSGKDVTFAPLSPSRLIQCGVHLWFILKL